MSDFVFRSYLFQWLPLFFDDLVCNHFLAIDAMAIQAGDDVITVIDISRIVPIAPGESPVLTLLLTT